jgi:hypothetical protein
LWRPEGARSSRRASSRSERFVTAACLRFTRSPVHLLPVPCATLYAPLYAPPPHVRNLIKSRLSRAFPSCQPSTVHPISTPDASEMPRAALRVFAAQYLELARGARSACAAATSRLRARGATGFPRGPSRRLGLFVDHARQNRAARLRMGERRDSKAIKKEIPP